MHIGFDIDGVISKRDHTHVSLSFARFLLYLGKNFFPGALQQWTLSQPLQDDIEVARELAKQHSISIITARPKHLEKYTDQWLRTVAQIDFDRLYCVGLQPGFGERKLQIAKRTHLDMFLDDTQSTIDVFQNAGIPAQLFCTWKEVELPVETKHE